MGGAFTERQERARSSGALMIRDVLITYNIYAMARVRTACPAKQIDAQKGPPFELFRLWIDTLLCHYNLSQRPKYLAEVAEYAIRSHFKTFHQFKTAAGGVLAGVENH